MKLLFALIGAVVFSVVSSMFFKAPYVWISLCWFAVLIYASVISKRSGIKAVWFNIVVIIFLFGVYEAYLWFREPAEYWYIEKSTKEPNWQDHDFLGQVMIKNDKTDVTKYYGKNQIWHSVYTIDSQGLRISPPDIGGDDIKSILFFGDSFMFGWGLNDSETFPYQVGLKTKGNFRIYNFGVPAYGPHHMLSAIEHGLVKDTVKGRPVYAIYEAILDHVNRAAGTMASRNPKYVLNKNGDVIYQGRFDEFYILPLGVKKELGKSRVFSKILNRQRFINSNDIDLFTGIIVKSRDLLKELNPDIKFHLILYSATQYESEKITIQTEELINKLKLKGIPVHVLSDFINIDTREKWVGMKISPLDGHPNAKANGMIADYVVKEIIKE